MSTLAENLSPKQAALISALMTEATVAAAAKRAGCSARSARRWLGEPAFCGAYREARRAALDVAMARLQAAGAEFVQVLREVATDTGAPSSARVSAARAGLEMA